MLDDQAAYRLAVSGIDVDRDLIACRRGADRSVVDVESHGTVSGVDIGSDAVLLAAVVIAAVASVAGIAGVSSVARITGVAAVASIAGSNSGGNGDVERAAGLYLCKVAGIVQRLEQLGVLTVVNAVACDHIVCGLAGADLMRNDLIAGSADCRSLGRGQKQSLARSDLVPAGDVVELLDLIGIVGEADAQRVADARNSLAALDRVRDQIISDTVAALCGADGSCRCAGRAGAGAAAGHDLLSRSVSRRQLDHSAHGQESEVVFTLQPVELYNSILAGEVVDALFPAEFKYIVAGLEGILDHLRISVVCISAYGQPREQGHDHEHCQQNTDDPFLHICSP